MQMNRLSFIGIISAMLFLLVAMPGVFCPVYGQVTIDSERTSTVNLDEEPNSGSDKTVTVTDTGNVHVTGSQNAITAYSDGWTLQVKQNGKVESTASSAVYFTTGTVNNNGVIAARKTASDLLTGNGIFMKHGTVINTNLIKSDTNRGIAFNGIDANKINTVYNTGVIEGAGGAIFSTIAMNVTNGVGASMIGGINSNIFINATSTITNYGSITAPLASVDAVRLNSGIVQNLGKDSLVEGCTGVTFRVNGKVTNEGIIWAHKDFGIYFYDSGTVENSGTIKATDDIGVGGQHRATGIYVNKGKVDITNSGTISGEVGIRLSSDDYDDTLDNSGTIQATKAGGNGTAVDMGGGDDKATFRRGTRVTGWVDGGDGADTMEFNDAGTQVDFKARNLETLTFTGGETILTGTGSSLSIAGETAVLGGATANIDGLTNVGGGATDGFLNTGSLGVKQRGTFNTATLNLGTGGTVSNRGAVNVAGTYTQGSDSTYEVGAAADHTFAKIKADKAVIDGGTIIFNLVGVRGGKHLIVGTTSGLQGKYDHYEFTGNYAHWQYEYDPDNLYLTLAWDFTENALTRNQRAVSRYLNNVINSPSGFISEDMLGVYGVLPGLDPGSFRLALDQMGGTSHTAYTIIDTYRTANFYRNLFRRSSSLTSNAMEGRGSPLTMLAANMKTLTDGGASYITKDRKKDPFNLWIKGYGTTGDRDGDDIASRYDFTVGGTMAGMDFNLTPAVRAGVALAYAKTDMNMKDLRDRGSEDSLQGAIYGSYTPKSNRWYMDLAFAYSRNSYETSRYINFGTVSRVAKGSYKGSDLSGYIESGYRIPATGCFAVTPYASFLALQNYRGGFTERGAQALSLVTDGANTLSLQGALGVRVARDIRIAKTFLVTPELSARWVHEFGDDEVLLDARLAGAPSGSFTVYSDRFDRDSGVLSLGITGKVKDNWSFFLAYDAQVRARETVHSATGGVKFKW